MRGTTRQVALTLVVMEEGAQTIDLMLDYEVELHETGDE